MIEVFSESAMRTIRRVVRGIVAEESKTEERPRAIGARYVGTYVGVVASEVSARSGTTPGSGTVTLYTVDSTPTLAAATGEGGALAAHTVYSLSTDAFEVGSYVVVNQDLLSGKYWLSDMGSGGPLKIGVLTGNVGHGAIGTLRLHDQSGASLPAERSPIVDLSVLNITGTTMKAGPWMYGEFIEAFDQWIVHPAMIEGCLTPEFDPNNDAANGGAVTASVGENVRYDPDGASGAVTITFPESTTLQDGETFRTENWNQTSTTGITLQANSSSPLDKIEDPSDRTAAYASSHAGVVTTRYVVDWALDTNNYGNPTWKVASLLDS